ncbi:proteophosphoglycan ppg4 [Variovorax sp. RT4R15]|uniref:proteophosphoglycan ppg4 n=1 Tax=Variovorax sp. RT4R15 TaxID=3443737 RepID=UPI003F471775
MKFTSPLFAALLFGSATLAWAQGTPPTVTPANPATAAGQQSPAGGPMGTTGTLPQNQAPTAAPAAAPAPAPMDSTAPPMRRARADRN